jgi:hypothetical protein
VGFGEACRIAKEEMKASSNDPCDSHPSLLFFFDALYMMICSTCMAF